MSDEALRSAERQYRTTQSLADAAAMLGARVRAGKIKPEFLQLAALLGHPAASLSVQGDHPRPPSDPAVLLRALTDWEPEVQARAAAAVAFRALAALTASERGSEIELRRDYVNIANRAVRNRRGRRFDCALPPRYSLHRNKRGEILQSFQSVVDLLRKKSRKVVEVFRTTGNLVRTATEFDVAEADLTRAVASDLLPWITGDGDPLLTRLDDEREWLSAPPPERPQAPPPPPPVPTPGSTPRARTPALPVDARRQKDREKSPPATLSGEGSEKFLVSLRASLKATNRGITCRLTEADVLFAALRSTTATEGVAWMIAPDPAPYAWSDRKHALVLAWSRKGRTYIRLIRVRAYRGNVGTPASWPELRGFPRGDLLAKLSAWSEAADALTFKTKQLTTQRSLSSAHHADVSVLPGK